MISQTFQGQCLQNCCKFCLKCANSVLQSDVVLFIVTVPLSDVLCVIHTLLNIFQTDPICCPTLDSWLRRMKFAQTLSEMLLTIGNTPGDFVSSRHLQTGSRRSTVRSTVVLTFALDEVNINRQKHLISSHFFSTQTQHNQSVRCMFTSCTKRFKRILQILEHFGTCFIGKLPMINEMKISSRGPKIIVQSEEKLCVGVRLSDLLWGDRITVFKAPSGPDVCWSPVCEVTGSYPESYQDSTPARGFKFHSAFPSQTWPQYARLDLRERRSNQIIFLNPVYFFHIFIFHK